MQELYGYTGNMQYMQVWKYNQTASDLSDAQGPKGQKDGISFCSAFH